MSNLNWTRNDWHETANAKEDDYLAPRFSVLHPHTDATFGTVVPGFQVHFSHKHVASEDQAKRLAEHICADVLALDAKIDRFIAMDGAAPSIGEQLARDVMPSRYGDIGGKP